MMNKLLLLFIPFLFISFSGKKSLDNDYSLTIKHGKIIKDNGVTILEIPVTLTNNTKEKLSYGSMSCSWQDFYTVKSKDLYVEGTPCDKNIPVQLELDPSQNKTVLLRLQIKKPSAKNAVTFKIGFNLVPVNTTKQWEDFFEDLMSDKLKKNIIWSNQITIKLK